MVRAALRIVRAALPAAALLGAPARAPAQVFQYDLTDAGSLGSFGAAVEGNIDFDHDGYVDLLVGAPLAIPDVGLALTLGGP